MDKYRDSTRVNNAVPEVFDDPLITLPNPDSHAMSIRATALVFADPASTRLLEYIERIAPSDATVLIIGETGTGKELAARQVHTLSHRREKPFIAVNCGAISESLVESELFGHERGAFTGALNKRVGWFEAANGGTLFLDEIGDLPLSAQVKILRVLQEREVVRLGSSAAIPISVRLIAATNINLLEAVEAGRFREDLYHRLKVASLNLLPLRERPGDILPLVWHFMERYGERLKLTRVELCADAEYELLNYAWPGNIRELENVIHHALLIFRNGKITAPDLHLNPNFVVKHNNNNATQSANPSALKALENALTALYEHSPSNLFEKIEETIIRTAYAHCENNQVQTGYLLGISRNILRHKLKRYGYLT